MLKIGQIVNISNCIYIITDILCINKRTYYSCRRRIIYENQFKHMSCYIEENDINGNI